MSEKPAVQRTRKRTAQRPPDPLAPPKPDAAEPRPLDTTPAPAPASPKAAAPPPPIERPQMRAPLREDPRTAADARALEIMEHLGSMDQGTDEFYIDPRVIPDGWSYEWKRQTVYGMADPAYEVALARTGWTAVPASRHPEMMPGGWDGNIITRKGQMLMERPQKITDMVIARDNRAARDQVRVKEEQLSSAPAQGQLPRAGDPGGDKRTAPNIKKSFEPMPVPADAPKA